MDYDLVLQVTEEELLDFPEEGPCEGHLEPQSTGTVVPDCSQDSLQIIQDFTENTPQKEEVHLPNPSNTLDRNRGSTPNKDFQTSTTTIPKEDSTVYASRRPQHVGFRRRQDRTNKWEQWSQRRQKSERPQGSAWRSHRAAPTANTRNSANNARPGVPNVPTGSRKTRARRSRRIRSRIIRQLQCQWVAQGQGPCLLR